MSVYLTEGVDATENIRVETMYKRKLCLGLNADFGDAEEEQIEAIARAGFDGFFTGWQPGAPVGAWRRLADRLGLCYQSIHAPFGRAADMWKGGDCAEAAVGELLACLRDCSDQQVPIMVAHAFIGFEEHSPNERGVANYERVAREAERLGVTMALENTEGEEYLAKLMPLADAYGSVGFCWDSGHEMCYNRSRDLLALYGKHLVCTHLNDNLGIRDFDGRITWLDDLHLLPFDGVADWKAIAARLNRCGYDGAFTFELNRKSKPDRHENDCYGKLSSIEYLTEAYKRACRVAYPASGF